MSAPNVANLLGVLDIFIKNIVQQNAEYALLNIKEVHQCCMKKVDCCVGNSEA